MNHNYLKEELKEVFGFKEDFFTQTDEFIQDEEIKKWLDVDMHKYANELGKFERVKNYIIKRRPFTLEGGELTPTQKAKRKVIEQKFEAEIKGMYHAIVE